MEIEEIGSKAPLQSIQCTKCNSRLTINKGDVKSSNTGRPYYVYTYCAVCHQAINLSRMIPDDFYPDDDCAVQ